MLKRFILLGLGFLPLIIQAQITINAQLPPTGLVQKDQLWYMILANSKSDVINVSIKMSLQDAITGQIVMSANSGSLLLGKGIKIITSRDIQPITYNFNAADFSRGYLPMGSYIACYQVYHIGEKGDEPLGDECVRINIDPLSPPLLNSPADKSEVQSPYPQFTWMPPTPFDMFNDLNYEILVTEVMSGQSSTEAIQYNTPMYTKSSIIQTFESYPSSFKALDTGKIYAWQIVAKNGLNYATKTEIWTFKVRPETINNLVDGGNYFLLDNQTEGIYTVEGNVLNLKYVSNTLVQDTTIVIADEYNAIVQSVPRTIKRGDNYFSISLGNGFIVGRVYKATITDMAQRKQSIRFKIISN